jgi:hypothetical protein
VEMGDDHAMAIGTKFLNTITLVGMPPHHLALKVGVLVILLRNLDATSKLCNGTCLIIWRVTRRLIVTQIIGGTHAGNIVNIPRIMTTTSRLKWPFTLQRRQFPLQLAFVMTMKIVGIYLLEHVFTHGQLYVALSRAMRVNDVFVCFLLEWQDDDQCYLYEIVAMISLLYFLLIFFSQWVGIPTSKSRVEIPCIGCKNGCTKVTFMTCSC